MYCKKVFWGNKDTMLHEKDHFGFESGVMDVNSSPNIYLDAMFISTDGFEFLKSYSGPVGW